MRYDVNIFVRNYKHLIKQKGMKINEVEKKIEVAEGYFNRFEKKKKPRPEGRGLFFIPADIPVLPPP